MKPLFLMLILALAPCFALGKNAADYFHDAAYKYVAGRHQEASVEADEGLNAYPGDPQLQMLSDLLKQMKDQQRQDQNQSGGGSQNKQDQNKQNQNGKNGQNKDQQNKDQNNPNNQNNPNKQNPQNKQQPPQDSSGQGKNQKSQQPPPPPKPEEGGGADSLGKSGDTSGSGQMQHLPGQMSKEDAERLLNSFIDEENQAQQNRLGTPHKPASGGQNW